MPSPFPGMDPFIEAQGKWEDFHHKLLSDMERLLSEALPPRYAVRVGERSYIDYVEPHNEQSGTHAFQPDVSIKSEVRSQNAESVTSVLEAQAIDMEGRIEAEIREIFLEIHELDPQERLVTAIEVLSPSNKRPGTVGWYQYERKRQAFLEGHANLVEIDLVRAGRRMAMTSNWPESPYYVMIVRKENAPRCKVWAAHFREMLPPIPIPLAPPDADVPIDLQPIVDDIYRRSRYRLDYTRPLRMPLLPADADWLAKRLSSKSS